MVQSLASRGGQFRILLDAHGAALGACDGSPLAVSHPVLKVSLSCRYLVLMLSLSFPHPFLFLILILASSISCPARVEDLKGQ